MSLQKASIVGPWIKCLYLAGSVIGVLSVAYAGKETANLVLRFINLPAAPGLAVIAMVL
jgi:hypothetical protein